VRRRASIWLAAVVPAAAGCSLMGYPSGGPPGEPAPAAASQSGPGPLATVAADAPNPDDVPNAVPKKEPLSPYGNPPEYKVDGVTYHVLHNAKGYAAEGIASWYGPDFQGKRTSSGEPYDMYAMTAAHKTLPIPTYVEVTNLENGKKVIVRVNDRGPFEKGRIIDLSYIAALKLGIVGAGSARVRVRALTPGK
jgi:peptidoglycan lytic transglycosylase